MRISDWSSDVCSSDLIGRRTTMIRLALAVAGLAALAPVALAQPASSVITANKAALREPAKSRFVNAVQVYPYNEGALFRLFAAPEPVSDIAQIGRASCRERVGQYGEIRVVRV